MEATLVLCFISAIFAILAWYEAKKASSAALLNNLYDQWRGAKKIRMNNPTPTEVKIELHRISYTASLWRHNRSVRSMIYQEVARAYMDLYDDIKIVSELPCIKDDPDIYLSNEMTKAYEYFKKKRLKS